MDARNAPTPPVQTAAAVQPPTRHADGAASDLRAVLDALPALVGYWDRDLRNRFANAAYVEYFGADPRALYGMHARDVLGAEVFENGREQIEAALRGEHVQFDRELVDAEGRRRFTQAAYVPHVVDGEIVGFIAMAADITARREAERESDAAQARFRTLFDHAPLGTLVLDHEGRILQANHAAVALFGHSRDRLLTMTILDVTLEEDRAASLEARRRLAAGELASYRLEKRYVRADGKVIWAQLDATLLEMQHDGRPIILNQIHDVTDQRLYKEELERLATVDPLTGLANRRRVIEALAETPAGAVLLLDLDRFKLVNDVLGHAAGDEVLVRVADILRRRTRSTDVVGRLGGDEFVVVLRDADAAAAALAAGELAEQIAEARLGIDERWVTASVGMATIADAAGPEQVLAAADRAMYAAKRADAAA